MMKSEKQKTTRRKFLFLAVGASSAVALDLRGSASPLPAELSRDPRRPQFHLLPARNWMNDPNGPVYFAGKYHMFFQYNPEGVTPGNISWNHAISEDMLHWKNYPVAMTPTPGGPDAAGCFTGSAIVAPDGQKQRVCMVYTGVVRDPEHATIRGEGLKESQCLAWSDDPLLLSLHKRPEPLIAAPPAGMAITGFRDPSVWRQNGTYYMTVGSGVQKVGGCVLLYRSSNLLQWEYLHPLIEGKWDGKATTNPVGDGEMWECPELFPLGGGHVLIYSSMEKVFWLSGTLDTNALKFIPRKKGLLDLGAFYAPKTQLDAQGRRILWGWITERRSKADMVAAGWAGMMSLPRVLELDAAGSLRMQTVPEAQALRGTELAQRSEQGYEVCTLPQANGEVTCQGASGASLQFGIYQGGTELLNAIYQPETHSWFAEGQNFPLETAEDPAIHGFVDGSVIELNLSSRIAWTKRFYYPGSVAPDLLIRVKGKHSGLHAWKVRPISPDRMTTVVSPSSAAS